MSEDNTEKKKEKEYLKSYEAHIIVSDFYTIMINDLKDLFTMQMDLSMMYGIELDIMDIRRVKITEIQENE
jgi:hypothetical protein